MINNRIFPVDKHLLNIYSLRHWTLNQIMTQLKQKIPQYSTKESMKDWESKIRTRAWEISEPEQWRASWSTNLRSLAGNWDRQNTRKPEVDDVRNCGGGGVEVPDIHGEAIESITVILNLRTHWQGWETRATADTQKE